MSSISSHVKILPLKFANFIALTMKLNDIWCHGDNLVGYLFCEDSLKPSCFIHATHNSGHLETGMSFVSRAKPCGASAKTCNST